MKRIYTFKWSLLLLVINLLGAAYFTLRIPNDVRIPIHWNAYGEIDGWASKTGALGFMVGISILMFLMMYLMPYYSPWYRKYKERMERVVPRICFILILFFTLLTGYSFLLAEKETQLAGINPVLFMIGLLFIMLGNILPKVPKNFFIGIKTPWTLVNDEVWQKTHRLGGWLFVISGLIMLLKSIVPSSYRSFQTVSMILTMGIVLYPIVYSFILYKKIKQTN